MTFDEYGNEIEDNGKKDVPNDEREEKKDDDSQSG